MHEPDLADNTKRQVRALAGMIRLWSFGSVLELQMDDDFLTADVIALKSAPMKAMQGAMHEAEAELGCDRSRKLVVARR